MARPRTITNQQIVEAAREVFLEQGFSAPTAEIARRAGISEGTLFKRFSCKEALFAEVIGRQDQSPWHGPLETLVGVGEVRANLERVAWLYVEFVRQTVPQLIMIWSRGQALPELHDWARTFWQRDVAALSGYLAAEVKLGRLRAVNTDVVAEAFLGALSTYLHREFLRTLPETQAPGISAAEFIAALLDTWYLGLAAPEFPA